MKTIRCPVITTTGDIISDINSFPHKVEKENRIKNSKEAIEILANKLKSNCESGTFLVPSALSPIDATKKDMVSLYEQKFRKSNYYGELINGSNICPICGVNNTGCIDHYFPKSIHYLFSVTPFNLVPFCIRCNLKKLESDPQNLSFHVFHAYFDTIDESLFLEMDLYFDCLGNFVPIFTIVGNESDKKKMYKSNFDFFGLKQLYEEEATKLFYNNIGIWKMIFKNGGYVELKNYFYVCSNAIYPDPVYGKFYKSLFAHFDDLVHYLVNQ